jgi:hypothetical protein
MTLVFRQGGAVAAICLALALFCQLALATIALGQHSTPYPSLGTPYGSSPPNAEGSPSVAPTTAMPGPKPTDLGHPTAGSNNAHAPSQDIRGNRTDRASGSEGNPVPSDSSGIYLLVGAVVFYLACQFAAEHLSLNSSGLGSGANDTFVPAPGSAGGASPRGPDAPQDHRRGPLE